MQSKRVSTTEAEEREISIHAGGMHPAREERNCPADARRTVFHTARTPGIAIVPQDSPAATAPNGVLDSNLSVDRGRFRFDVRGSSQNLEKG